MYYLFVLLSTVIFYVGIVTFIKRPFFLFCKSAASQLDVLLNFSLGEIEKQRLLIQELKLVLVHFSQAVFLLLLILFIATLPTWLYVKIISIPVVDLHSAYFYLSIALGSGVFFIYPKKASDYSYWSKLMHTMVLDNYNIGKRLFKFEQKLSNKSRITNNDNFVIITGLARSGTTALTNLLFESKTFHSLSYANMPFLLAPRLWSKIYKPKTKKTKERAHGDTVLFGENSIEALEEYFFKVFLDDCFVGGSSMDRHEVSQAVYDLYLTYQGFFRKPKSETRYLAKNNNFMLRYKSLRKHNQNFKVVLIFRSPVEHAFSLLKQHENFCQQQSKDPFIKTYMDWLGHHEFGLNQKVFDFGQENIWNQYEKNSMNYWLAVWLNYYQYVLTCEEDYNLFLIDYQDLLVAPDKLRSKLSRELNVQLGYTDQKPFEKPDRDIQDFEFDEQLLTTAQSVHAALLRDKVQVD